MTKKTVICDRTDYENKMSELISDTTQFQIMTKGPTNSCATTLNNIIKTVKEKNFITRRQPSIHNGNTTTNIGMLFDTSSIEYLYL